MSLGMTLPSFIRTRGRQVLDWVERSKIQRQVFEPENAVSGPRLFYFGKTPKEGEVATGGRIKLIALNQAFPEDGRRCNLAYLVSSALPTQPQAWMKHLRNQGIHLVWNQNGVAYPGWAGAHWQKWNEPMTSLHLADAVVFQSDFCRQSAEMFLGKYEGKARVIFNPVDTDRFIPGNDSTPMRPPTILLSGSQYQRYRLFSAIDILCEIRHQIPDVVLKVTGRVGWSGDDAADRMEVQNYLKHREATASVQWVGPYTQEAAPEIYRSADVLLHTKYNDPCPTVILEAMASGLPIVYSRSGGVPELVGEDAGVGIPVALDWEQEPKVDVGRFALAVTQALEHREALGNQARARAVARFNVPHFIEAHQQLFGELLVV